MKNIKVKLTIIMVTTTFILFTMTFLAINFYQKNYIFDKAISSLENEVMYFNNQDDGTLYLDDKDRFYNVDILLLDESIYKAISNGELMYLTREEELFKSLYKDGSLPLDEIVKLSNDFGDYYVTVSNIPKSTILKEFFITSNDENNNQAIPVIFYTDITLSNNIVNHLNVIFFIMLFITILVEGIIGIYLGTRFEDSQTKLKNFFQNASHELKTPLMSIQGYAEGIKTDVIKDHDMASEVIIKQSEKMKLLVDELLNISRLDSKEYVLKQEKIDIRDVLEESLLNFESFANEKSIDIKIDLDENNTEIIADGLQIYKAINTIVDNAFKYAVSKVEIKSYVKKSYLYIDVYNDGEKIDKEKASHIFDRFYSTNDLSTGIGLAMAKEILILTKGDIVLKNVKDGVVFEIKIPI